MNLPVKKLDIFDDKTIERVLELQKSAYQIEAKLLHYHDLPPLKDTYESLRKSQETFMGAFVDKTIVGVISYKKIEDVIDIHRLFVDPDSFRKGIATLLLLSLETDEKITRIIVSTGLDNKPAIRLYEKNGYRIHKTEMIDNDLNIVRLFKNLNY